MRACHELRGPLTAARLGIQLGMRRGGLSMATLRAIDLELGRATVALGDLAACLDGVEQEPDIELVEVGELLADSVEAWQAAALERDVSLELGWQGGDARVWGERLRLARATGNLVANAIEHGGGRVRVGARVEAGSVRIEVSDDGPGLPAPVAELAQLAGRRGLRGRGLAIAAAVAQDHGGRLAAAPSESGARLVLELPLSVHEQDSAQTE
jgi:signal transduction histidine kinase